MPPPEPRSRTVSPDFSSASAVGLPHPNDAFSACSGTWLACVSSYMPELIGSQEAAAEPSQQLVWLQQSAGSPVPSSTRRAAVPYFSFTKSRISMMLTFLSADLGDLCWFDCLVARAALRVQKSE